MFRSNKPSGSIRLGNTGQLHSWLVGYMGRVAKLFLVLYFLALLGGKNDDIHTLIQAGKQGKQGKEG